MLEAPSVYLQRLAAFQACLEVQFRGANTWHHQGALPFGGTPPSHYKLLFSAELSLLVKASQVQMQN